MIAKPKDSLKACFENVNIARSLMSNSGISTKGAIITFKHIFFQVKTKM